MTKDIYEKIKYVPEDSIKFLEIIDRKKHEMN